MPEKTIFGTTKVIKTTPNVPFFLTTSKLAPNTKWVSASHLPTAKSVVGFPISMAISSTSTHTSSPVVSPDVVSDAFGESSAKLHNTEERIEKFIYGSRFLAILAVWGSLIGSFVCFIKGCTYVVEAFQTYLVNRGKVIMLLVEAIDVYLLGTVMLVFGVGLYELFISNLGFSKSQLEERCSNSSNFFGLFTLKERPAWLEIKSVNELKTKVGHVIVMLLLIGLFEKSKKAVILSPVDLLCFSASVLLCSGCLYLLSKLNDLD